MKKLTLQWRITILSALVLLVCTAVLTYMAIYNAEGSFQEIAEMKAVTVIPSTSAEVPLQEDMTIAVPVIPAQRIKTQFNIKSILWCILFSTLGTVTVYILAGSALRPLRELSRRVETIDENTLSKRLPEPVSKDEVSRLTDSFNEMLSRLEDAFIRQKRFTANAAHELKTPLAVLKTGAQVLTADKGASIDDYQENMTMTLANIERLTKIVNDLLLLSSASEFVDENREEVLLEALFDAITSELAPLLDARSVTCHIQCSEYSVYGNPSLLYRIFYNLIENACKYGCVGGMIRLTARQEADRTEICVRDDGPGIPEAHLPYLFDAFYRVDKSRSRESGGSGLGLSIVKTMVEACGGTVSVESGKGRGTCFTVTLP